MTEISLHAGIDEMRSVCLLEQLSAVPDLSDKLQVVPASRHAAAFQMEAEGGSWQETEGCSHILALIIFHMSYMSGPCSET